MNNRRRNELDRIIECLLDVREDLEIILERIKYLQGEDVDVDVYLDLACNKIGSYPIDATIDNLLEAKNNG